MSLPNYRTMKKILYIVTHSKLGGAQRYILDLSKNLKNDYDITVAFGEQANKGELGLLLDKAGIKKIILPHLQKSINPINSFKAYLEIKKLILELRPDILHISSFKASLIGSLAVRRTRKKFSPYFIYSPHGWAFNSMFGWLKKKYFFLAEKYTAKDKDQVICINRPDYDAAQGLLGINAKKLNLIHHGIDISQYKFLTKDEAKRQLFAHIPHAKLPNEKTILIGSIGNLQATKGYYYLIKALHYLIIDYGFPITAIIIGEGPERKDLQERIIKFHPMDYSATDGDVSNKIILAGYIPDASQLLPAFDFYISTALQEGFPYTILEAMGAGLPIVATRTGGIPEMIKDGVNGLLIDTRNSRDLAKKISELIKNNDLRNRLSQQAQFDANHKFKFTKMLQETKEVYEDK